jgi:hypothetical protein
MVLSPLCRVGGKGIFLGSTEDIAMGMPRGIGSYSDVFIGFFIVCIERSGDLSMFVRQGKWPLSGLLQGG